VLEVGSCVLAATLLAGTAMIARGVRFGWLYLCGLQVPAGAYDVATRQYGLIAVSFVGGWLYWRGWQIRNSKNQLPPDLNPECPLVARYGYCGHCSFPVGSG
jgi:hypothetical protein